MHIARPSAVLVIAGALAATVTSPAVAAAPEPKHHSCVAWGQAFAAFAQDKTGPAGAVVSELGRDGVAAFTVHDEKAGHVPGVPGCEQ